MMSVEPPTKITWPDPNSEDPVLRLHTAIFNGECAKVKKIIKSGVSVEKAIGDGHTPLFCAAFHGQARVVKLLLKLEADPNRCCSVDKCTPMHAACWSGNKHLIKRMISAGGDLRFHDSNDRSPKDWASMQPDFEKRNCASDLLEDYHQKALNAVNDSQHEVSVSRGGSFGLAIRNLINPQLSKNKSENRGTDLKKFQGGVPLIDYHKFIDVVEDDDDAHVSSYWTGTATEMVSRLWGRQRVAVRRIGMDETTSDLLLKEEQKNLSQLRLFHPGLLLLMGVTQRLDKIQLVYEPVQLGSLYHRLHVARLPIPDKLGILIQVAEALDFLHSRKLLHCSISSHSIHLVSLSVAKLGCYETLTDINANHSSQFYRIYLQVPRTHRNFVMRWMSPEAAREGPLSIRSDIYSLCCVMLEIFREKVPWSRMDAEEIRAMWQAEASPESRRDIMLPVNSTTIPTDLKDVLKIGLQPKRDNRNLDLEHVIWKLQSAAAVASRQSDGSEMMSSSRFPVSQSPPPFASFRQSSSPCSEKQAEAYRQPKEHKVLSPSSVDRLSTDPPLIDLEEKSPPTPAQSSASRQRNFQRFTRALIARKRVTFYLARNQTSDVDHPAAEVDRLRSVFERGSNPTGSPQNVDFTRPPFKRQSSLLAIKPASHLTECPTVFSPGPGHDEKEVGEEDIGLGGHEPSSSPLLNGDIGFGGDRTNIGT